MWIIALYILILNAVILLECFLSYVHDYLVYSLIHSHFRHLPLAQDSTVWVKAGLGMAAVALVSLFLVKIIKAASENR